MYVSNKKFCRTPMPEEVCRGEVVWGAECAYVRDERASASPAKSVAYCRPEIRYALHRPSVCANLCLYIAVAVREREISRPPVGESRATTAIVRVRPSLVCGIRNQLGFASEDTAGGRSRRDEDQGAYRTNGEGLLWRMQSCALCRRPVLMGW